MVVVKQTFYVYDDLLYYDKIYLYAKNLEQAKNQKLIKQFEDISEECG